MLYPLGHVRHHQNPLADTPALASCQAPQLGRPRFAAKKVCWHTPSPKHGTLAHQLYHIWGSPEAGIIRTCLALGPAQVRDEPWPRCTAAGKMTADRGIAKAGLQDREPV